MGKTIFCFKNFGFIMVIIAVFLLPSCSEDKKTGNIETTAQKNEIAKGENMKYALIETDKGTIKAEIYSDKVPITAKNFIDLANSGFYNGLAFHRVEPGFVVQGGDPKGDGTGGSGKKIPLEINPSLKHVKGALAMARTNDPNSATSQFYITLAPTPFLDGNYAVFGKVIAGMDAVEKIRVGDKINKVSITDS